MLCCKKCKKNCIEYELERFGLTEKEGIEWALIRREINGFELLSRHGLSCDEQRRLETAIEMYDGFMKRHHIRKRKQLSDEVYIKLVAKGITDFGMFKPEWQWLYDKIWKW